jgi:transposase
LFADRGYDYDKYRRLLRARSVTPKIACRGTAHGSGLGRTRWVVEPTFAWLHQFKRLRIRYAIRADLHLGLLQLACCTPDGAELYVTNYFSESVSVPRMPVGAA